MHPEKLCWEGRSTALLESPVRNVQPQSDNEKALCKPQQGVFYKTADECSSELKVMKDEEVPRPCHRLLGI